MIKLTPYTRFEDDRGSLTGITREPWAEVNIIETRAGEVRGGHYHRETRELFYIVAGEVHITVRHTESGESHTFTAGKGDLFVVEPLEVHTFETRTDALWINMLSKPLDQENPDFFRDPAGTGP